MIQILFESWKNIFLHYIYNFLCAINTFKKLTNLFLFIIYVFSINFLLKTRVSTAWRGTWLLPENRSRCGWHIAVPQYLFGALSIIYRLFLLTDVHPLTAWGRKCPGLCKFFSSVLLVWLCFFCRFCRFRWFFLARVLLGFHIFYFSYFSFFFFSLFIILFHFFSNAWTFLNSRTFL